MHNYGPETFLQLLYDTTYTSPLSYMYELISLVTYQSRCRLFLKGRHLTLTWFHSSSNRRSSSSDSSTSLIRDFLYVSCTSWLMYETTVYAKLAAQKLPEVWMECQKPLAQQRAWASQFDQCGQTDLHQSVYCKAEKLLMAILFSYNSSPTSWISKIRSQG